MDSLDVNQLATEVVAGDDLGFQGTDAEDRERKSVPSNDKAAVALEMVSEAAAAIRKLKEQSAQVVARAQDLVDSVVKRLASVEGRAECAEAAQRESAAKVQELSAALARTRADLDIARRQLAKQAEQLSAAEERVRLTEVEARAAQQRAKEANAKIENIVEAIRTQLPSREDLSAPI